MTTEAEAREIWAAIEAFQKKDAESLAAQQKIESDQRRAQAISYINALPLAVDDRLPLDEQKLKHYQNMELLKQEIKNSTYSELSQECKKEIENQLQLANLVKDQQRSLKNG